MPPSTGERALAACAQNCPRHRSGWRGVNVADLARVAPEISAWNQAETLPSRPTYAKSAMISWLKMIQSRRADNSRWSPLIDAAGSGRGRRAEPLGVRGACT